MKMVPPNWNGNDEVIIAILEMSIERRFNEKYFFTVRESVERFEQRVNVSRPQNRKTPHLYSKS
jgi:hypothetical protein